MRSLWLVPVLVTMAQAQETPPYAIVSEYVREVCQLGDLEHKAGQEGVDAEHPLQGVFVESTRMRVAMDEAVQNLQGMKPPKAMAAALSAHLALCRQKAQLLAQVADLVFTLSATPPAEQAELAKLAGKVGPMFEQQKALDQAQIKACRDFFQMLVDPKLDGKGRPTHLLISADQRDALIAKLDHTFDPDKADGRPLATLADTLRQGLVHHMGSDEPWSE